MHMMMPRLAVTALATVLLVPTVRAENPMRGQLLYENWCSHCHLTEIHYRVARKVDSWDKLLQMVRVWQGEMQLGWQAEDILDVASYLNRRYYRFPGVLME